MYRLLLGNNISIASALVQTMCNWFSPGRNQFDIQTDFPLVETWFPMGLPLKTRFILGFPPRAPSKILSPSLADFNLNPGESLEDRFLPGVPLVNTRKYGPGGRLETRQKPDENQVFPLVNTRKTGWIAQFC